MSYCWTYPSPSHPSSSLILLMYVPVPNSGKPHHLRCLLLFLGCQVLFEKASKTKICSLVSAEHFGLLGSPSHFSNDWLPAIFSTASPPSPFQVSLTSTIFTLYLWPYFLHLLGKLRSTWIGSSALPSYLTKMCPGSFSLLILLLPLVWRNKRPSSVSRQTYRQSLGSESHPSCLPLPCNSHMCT